MFRAEDGGALTLCAEEAEGAEGAEGADRIAVNRRFLLDALAAGSRERLILESGAPTAPLAIRRPDDETSFSVLMPVRLED